MAKFFGLQRFDKALGQHYKAWVLMRKHRLLGFLIFPLLINGLVFWGGLSLANEGSDWAISHLQTWWEMQANPTGWMSYLWKGLYVFIWLSIRILFFIVFAYFGGYLTLLLLSPVLVWLSQLSEAKLGGQIYPFGWREFLSNLFRGVLITLRCFALEILFMILFLVIGLLPIVGVVAPAGLFGVTAYYYGFSLMDYPLERRGYSLKQSVGFMRQNRGSVLGIGLPFSAVLLIPVLGPFLAGFVAIIGTVSATLEVLEVVEQS